MNFKLLTVRIAAAAILVNVYAACPGPESPAAVIPSFVETTRPEETPEKTDITESLQRIAEIERTGGFFPGLGLIESELREKAGDFAGAAVAAYKELSWAYGYGVFSTAQVEEGLQNALALFDDVSPEDSARSAGSRALKGCMAFNRGEWKEAEELLAPLLPSDEEPDSFLRWMLLVCTLEQNTNADKVRSARSAYGAIRARYTFFPEYWYRGALNIDAAYAEQCINIFTQGPFAQECRIILAAHFGISSGGMALRTRAEIEHVIRVSVSTNNPSALEELFPLLALPDNPFTLFALGAMQALASLPEWRSFFVDRSLKASGRLAERLNFILRS